MTPLEGVHTFKCDLCSSDAMVDIAVLETVDASLVGSSPTCCTIYQACGEARLVAPSRKPLWPVSEAVNTEDFQSSGRVSTTLQATIWREECWFSIRSHKP